MGWRSRKGEGHCRNILWPWLRSRYCHHRDDLDSPTSQQDGIRSVSVGLYVLVAAEV
jgi:hypothetical protein